MWAPTLNKFNPALDVKVRIYAKCQLFDQACESARRYEQSTGHKHCLWEQIIAGLVEQDEIERYGGE